jgi:dihydroorotate dehydrogenase (NAD+) catalytic subunit
MSNGKCSSAIVIKSRPISLASGIYDFRLQSDYFEKDEIGPGQFFAFRPQNDAPMVRPFSVARVGERGRLDFFIKGVGDNTWEYVRLQDWKSIEIFGPYGKKFELIPGIKKYIFIGGGTGAVGLFSLVKEVLKNDKKVEFIFGVKNRDDVFGEEIFKELGILPQIIVENKHSFYYQGLPTDLLAEALSKELPNTAVIACGPRPMLKKVFDLCSAQNVKCLVLVEELMACACHSCKGCAIEMNDGKIEYVCHDGPIFDASRINWNKFVPRPAAEIKRKSEKTEKPFETILRARNGRTIVLDYPWAIAPGCDGLEDAENYPKRKVGASHTKGVMLEPRLGNPMPRVCETGNGSMLNSIGLTGVGVEKFIKEDFPRWQKIGKPIFVQIAGETISEYILVASKLRDLSLAAVEINISCPNINSGGLLFGTDPKRTSEVVNAVRLALPDVPLIVKLTPNVTDIVSIASAAVDAGADFLAAINTLRGMRINTETRRPRLGKNYGGLSGQALLAVGISAVSQIYQANLGVPIIGMGGISKGQEALEYFIAGASMVEVGTAWFANKNIFDEITSTVTDYLQKNNIAHVQDLRGTAEL